jgi:glycosyltransferase involved in cell wall biosynthesis
MPDVDREAAVAIRSRAGERADGLRILVLSPLYPTAAQPMAGLFIRERMARVAKVVPLVVVSPQPWFPCQGLIRRLRPGYRPQTARHETQQGIDVHLPRFLAVPGVLRRLDGISMALACVPLLWRLRRTLRFTLIDAHFAYPAGDAATMLARWFGVPATITLRGTEPGHLARRDLRGRVVKALARASRVLAVSESLRRVAIDAGVPLARSSVVANGVDIAQFRPVDRAEARRALGIANDARVLVSVGGLVERKGFHRVIEILPELVRRFHKLVYLVVGGASPEGDMREALERQAADLGLADRVLFLGAIAPERLPLALSASDVFVLATRNEGWANVLLEAMACGLPVVTTDVGGNREVVNDASLGIVVSFGDRGALRDGVAQALAQHWDRDAIVAYARANAWEHRVPGLIDELCAVVGNRGVSR